MINKTDVEDELNHILQDIKITTPQVQENTAPKVKKENVPINSIDTQDEPIELAPLVDEGQNTTIQPVVIEDLELENFAVDNGQAMDQEFSTIDPQSEYYLPIRAYGSRTTLSMWSRPKLKRYEASMVFRELLECIPYLRFFACSH